MYTESSQLQHNVASPATLNIRVVNHIVKQPSISNARVKPGYYLLDVSSVAVVY